MGKSIGYAAFNSQTPLRPFHFERRDPKPQDVLIEILYCGVCHSDIHQARNEWKATTYPIYPAMKLSAK